MHTEISFDCLVFAKAEKLTVAVQREQNGQIFLIAPQQSHFSYFQENITEMRIRWNQLSPS